MSDDFPAQVLFEFRQGSLLTQLALRSGIGVTLAEVGQRLVTARATAARPTDARRFPPARRCAASCLTRHRDRQRFGEDRVASLNNGF
ncbi:MAG: hypothetical protein L0H96_23190 [Humibacillus sp.]|nr:hypothetical protein [Humibacillus sp.]MDN5779794.1 hypothetical protein [Humibacillus sp.]